MNKAIDAIEPQMVQRTTRAQRAESAASSAELASCHEAGSAKPAVVQPFLPRLIAEWQQRGPETLSGSALRKLRLAFALPQSVIIASAAG
jgi:hypothetical protein